MNFRQWIVKFYRYVGIALLVAVLLALLSYLTTNVYYASSTSWGMPELLTAQDPRVVAAVTALGDAEDRYEELTRQRTDAKMTLKKVSREVGEAEAFLATYGSALGSISSVFDRAMLQRALSQARVDADAGKERMARLEEDLLALEQRLAKQQSIVGQMQQVPYLGAAKGPLVVVFAPYRNLKHIEAGAALYRCWLELVGCSRVGVIKRVLPGEVTGRSPRGDALQRGVFAEAEISEAGAREAVLFVGGAPLLF